MPEYTHHECPDCQYSAVTLADGARYECPICRQDNARSVPMRRRAAVPGEKPEGRDDRPPPPEPAADLGDYVRAAERTRELVAEAHAQVPPECLPMWTIYDSPREHPGLVVARLWLTLPTLQRTDTVLRGNTVAEVRELLPLGLARLPRQHGDDPCIVESWI